MGADLQLSEDVTETIGRCARAVGDLEQLKNEVHELRLSSDPHAQFATALFELELARRGDPDARAVMLSVADSLLVFWREGTGEELAKAHPVLEDLWVSASTLLASFEVKRLERALAACWDARADAALLAVAIEDLQPEGNRRVEFARCLYHLELARMFVETSRAEFAKRAGLLSEAYQDEEVARQLIANDAGLEHLWKELVPYLDEFFEMLEEQAEKRKKAALAAEAAAQPVTSRISRAEVKTDPAIQAQPAPSSPVPLGEGHRVPSFRTLVGERKNLVPTELSTAVTPPNGFANKTTDPALTPAPPPPTEPGWNVEASAKTPLASHAGQPAVKRAPPPDTLDDVIEAEVAQADTLDGLTEEPAPAVAQVDTLDIIEAAPEEVVEPEPSAENVLPPPPPTNLTPPGSWFPPGGAPPPPPPDLTPPGAWFPPPGVRAAAPPPPPPDLTPPGAWFPPRTPSGEVELVDAVEVPPPLPPGAIRHSGIISQSDIIEVDLEEIPDDSVLAFWAHTFKALEVLPGEGARQGRFLASESRNDRKRLTTYLDGLGPHLAVPEARAFAALIRLMLAGQTKEKSLFGQPNPRRVEALETALSLLAPTPEAAGRSAVWFELDGPPTQEALARGLELLTEFLAFCARNQLDPLAQATVHRFASTPS